MVTAERTVPASYTRAYQMGGREATLPDGWWAKKVLAERHLIDFVRQAWHVIEPATPFVPGWHVDCICEHLEAVTRGELRDLLINIPPRAMKSTLVSVAWPVWEWGPQNLPHLRYVFNSYAETLSIRDALRSRRIIQSPWFQQRWGDRFALTSDQNAKTRYDNDKTGFRLATSVSGANTGEGGDRLVADDPHNVKEAESDLVRQGVLTWWDESMTTRRNSERSARIVVMQRVHHGDLSGHLLAEKGGYHHLCLPMEWEPRIYPKPEQPLEPGTPQPHDDCPIHSDPRTQPGEPLWPARFSKGYVASWAHDLGPYAAAGQLQQRPSPRKGAVFDVERIKPLPVWFDQPMPHQAAGKLTTFRQTLKRVVFIDLAWSEKKTADYTAMMHLGADLSDQTYILDLFNERVDEADLPDALAPLIALWKPEIIAVEEGAFQQPATQSFIQRLYRKLRELRCAVGVVSVKPSKDKVMRAQLPAGRSKAGLVYADKTAAWWGRFETQLKQFPLGSHDDMVDAWAGAEQLAIEKVDWQEVANEGKRQTYAIGIGGEEKHDWDPFEDYERTFTPEPERVVHFPMRRAT